MNPGSTSPTCTPWACSSIHSASDHERERGLGGAVGAGARARDARGGGGDVDDRARREDRSSGSSASVRRTWASKLIAIVRLHVLVAALIEALAPGRAGVVDEQVQPAVALGDVRADPLGRVLVRRGRQPTQLTRLCAQRRRQRGGQLAQPLLAARDEHERSARLARQPPGGGLADAAGGARHERHRRLAMGVASAADGACSRRGTRASASCDQCSCNSLATCGTLRISISTEHSSSAPPHGAHLAGSVGHGHARWQQPEHAAAEAAAQQPRARGARVEHPPARSPRRSAWRSRMSSRRLACDSFSSRASGRQIAGAQRRRRRRPRARCR